MHATPSSPDSCREWRLRASWTLLSGPFLRAGAWSSVRPSFRSLKHMSLTCCGTCQTSSIRFASRCRSRPYVLAWREFLHRLSTQYLAFSQSVLLSGLIVSIYRRESHRANLYCNQHHKAFDLCSSKRSTRKIGRSWPPPGQICRRLDGSFEDINVTHILALLRGWAEFHHQRPGTFSWSQRILPWSPSRYSDSATSLRTESLATSPRITLEACIIDCSTALSITHLTVGSVGTSLLVLLRMIASKNCFASEFEAKRRLIDGTRRREAAVPVKPELKLGNFVGSIAPLLDWKARWGDYSNLRVFGRHLALRYARRDSLLTLAGAADLNIAWGRAYLTCDR